MTAKGATGPESRSAWLRRNHVALPVAPRGTYLSVVLPCRFDESRVFGTFVSAMSNPTSRPIEVSAPHAWYFLADDRLELVGMLRGELAASFADVPAFELTGQAGIDAPTMRALLDELDVIVDRIAPDFFAGRTAPAADTARLLEIAGLVFSSSEYDAVRRAFPAFFEWLD